MVDGKKLCEKKGEKVTGCQFTIYTAHTMKFLPNLWSVLASEEL